MSKETITKPSFIDVAKEFLTPLELARLALSAPTLSKQPKVDGIPVLVIPGLGADDLSTIVLRGYLNWLGYSSFGWGLGRNVGNLQESISNASVVLEQKYELGGLQPISIVGWSLGGVIARELARNKPQLIKQIITLGSPVVGGPKYTTFGRFYRASQVQLNSIEAKVEQREKRPISVPLTAIYSRSDGVVGWQASIDSVNSQTEHLEVNATHLGLGISAEVFKILAQQLSRP
ncbi:alpha/beta hydrolase [Arenicella sp. 4NH20-0111]|uniref:esterase/lipase family protein n=1 Tax=Arenicella sp. 4NH20-0111 TaxID=3127648 RepID=UPI0031048A07